MTVRTALVQASTRAPNDSCPASRSVTMSRSRSGCVLWAKRLAAQRSAAGSDASATAITGTSLHDVTSRAVSGVSDPPINAITPIRGSREHAVTAASAASPTATAPIAGVPEDTAQRVLDRFVTTARSVQREINPGAVDTIEALGRQRPGFAGAPAARGGDHHDPRRRLCARIAATEHSVIEHPSPVIDFRSSVPVVEVAIGNIA